MSFPDRLWLIGGGNMGGAMLRAWLASGADPASITVIDPSVPDVPVGVAVVTRACDAGAYPGTIVLAVKPQVMDRVATDMLGSMSGQPVLLISVLAGVEEQALVSRFGAEVVVRAMPNLPVSIGRGVVALYSSSGDARWRATAEALMAPLGLVEWITDEALFHAVTALSGSGPGFVYRFIAALAEGGVALGLSESQAQRFAIATVEGAAALVAASGETPDALADRVASPNGTTRAGLNVLDDGDAVKALVAATLKAAARRSEELAAAAR